MLELARLLHDRPRRRTIRLISFGAEEQLSVGSAAYVRTHRREVSSKGRLMYNLDAYGSPLGWLQLHVNAHPDFEASFRPHFRAASLYYQTITSVVPYADHFPFAAAGLPAVFHYRVNCNAGRFFHHRPDDDVSRVSVEVVARDVSAVATWLDEDGDRRDAAVHAGHTARFSSGHRLVLGRSVWRLGGVRGAACRVFYLTRAAHDRPGRYPGASPHAQRPQAVPPIVLATLHREANRSLPRPRIQQREPQAVLAGRERVGHVDTAFPDGITGEPRANVGGQADDRCGRSGPELERQVELAVRRRDARVQPPHRHGDHRAGLRLLRVLEAAQHQP